MNKSATPWLLFSLIRARKIAARRAFAPLNPGLTEAKGTFAMARSQLPLPGHLRQLLRYEPDTGKLFWLERSSSWWNTRYAGTEAMATVSHGYKSSVIGGRFLLAHRVIWAIVYDEWPPADIDHINGNRADNRLCNLRAVDRSTNAKNMARSSRNTSGVIGISPVRDKWRACITSRGKLRVLGDFTDFADAVAARAKAEIEEGFHPNHGRAA